MLWGRDFTFTHRFIDIASTILVLCAGLAILAVAWMYVVDRTQTKQTIRRNFPVIGRFRYLFEHLGEFFRQYFFAMDREELPFNRAQRIWVYRAAKNVDNTVAFGSTATSMNAATSSFSTAPTRPSTRTLSSPRR